jgi:hypothetical protein
MTVRLLARRAGLGRLAYLGWHAPRGFVRRCAREGAVNLWLAARGRRAMEQAATRLPTLPRGIGAPRLEVHFLTGRRFWYQTAFCAHSLVRHAGEPIRVVLIDDGTLEPDQAAALRGVIPDLELVPPDAVRDRLDGHLPADRYPALRQRRLVYPHLRKLTDVHAGQSGWRLVLDSDMLFFRRPAALLGWLAAPARPCHMVDVENAYGYSPALLEELAGGPVPDRVNVGACGLRSDAIDWDRLEYGCRVTLEREGSHYLQEQALTAVFLAGRQCDVLPADEYVVRPTRAEARCPRAALHHYVAESKAWYFRDAWRHEAGSQP